MRYEVLLFDLDHCLLDSEASEWQAFEDTMGRVGIEPTPQLFEVYAELNGALWSAVENGELTPNDVRLRRWELFVSRLGLAADPYIMSETFVDGLGAHGEFYPGTERVLADSQRGRRLGLVTNGIGYVQRTRIARLRLDRFFDAYVISGEAGVAKPDPKIFERIAEDLGGVDKSSTLMIGDSLSSDIRGGIAFGIDTCWYNPAGRASDLAPTHVIERIDQLTEVI